MASQAVAVHPNLPQLITRYAAGESIPELAAESGVHRATLYRWMLAGIGDTQYYALVTDVLVQRVAEADHELSRAATVCDIARARERARYSRMDFERRRPHLYGQHTHVTVEHTGDLAEKLRRARERVIEGETVAEKPIAAPLQAISTDALSDNDAQEVDT